MNQEFAKVLKLLNLAEKLKFELRHSWLSSGRQESAAEHSWRVSLMVILLAPYLKEKINLEKAMKLSVIHDLVEAEAKDVPAFEAFNKKDKQEEKSTNESKAIENIRKILNNNTGNEIFDLFYEYENSSSYEAKFVKSLDKIECRIQHNEADIETWNDIEKPRSLFAADKYCEFDKAIKEFNEFVKEESRKKLKDADLNLAEIEKESNRLRDI